MGSGAQGAAASYGKATAPLQARLVASQSACERALHRKQIQAVKWTNGA